MRSQQLGVVACLCAHHSSTALRLAATLVAIFAVAPAFAEPPPPIPKVQDFRKIPVTDRQQIGRENLVPFVDQDYLLKRIFYLMRDIDSGYDRNLRELKARKLSYHIVARTEGVLAMQEPMNLSRQLDIHLFGADSIENAEKISHLADPERVLLAVIDNSAKEVVKLAGFSGEPTADKADILVYVNLADRRQASTGFSFEEMPTYTQRISRAANPEKLKQRLFALPWGWVRLYYKEEQRGEAFEIDVLGGEIWIEYPLLTHLQEIVARYALDDRSLANQLGLGQSAGEIASRYRVPSMTTLPHFQTSARSPQQIWPDAFPGTSLLSIALKHAMLFSREDIGQNPFSGFGSRCKGDVEFSPIGGRLTRAFAMFRTGLRLGAYRVEPSAAAYADYVVNPGQFLARLSLSGYEQSFDQRLDDELALIVLSRLVLVEPKLLETQAPKLRERDLLARDVQASALASGAATRALISVALKLQTGDGCLTKSQIAWPARDELPTPKTSTQLHGSER